MTATEIGAMPFTLTDAQLLATKTITERLDASPGSKPAAFSPLLLFPLSENEDELHL